MTASDSITSLADDLPGAVVLPGDPSWDAARTPWDLAVDQKPAAVVFPRTAQEVAAAVGVARSYGLEVAAQGNRTQCGAPAAHGGLAGSLLLNMSHMRGVGMDPQARIARAEAGVLWGEVTAAAAAQTPASSTPSWPSATP